MSNKNLSTSTNLPIATGETVSKPDDVFNAELAAEVVRRTDKLNDNSIELALRVKQAREFMAWSAAHLRGCWLDWQTECGKALADALQSRMAFERETKLVLAQAKDTRDFFNSPEYLQAHAKLEEMVSLMERMQNLKADGTLDAFADFILHVSCGTPQDYGSKK